MTIRAGSAYADLGHVERTWATMLSTCLYLRRPLCFRRACTLSRACTPSRSAPAVGDGRRSRMTEDVPGAYGTDTYVHQPRIRYPVPIELTRTSIAT